MVHVKKSGRISLAAFLIGWFLAGMSASAGDRCLTCHEAQGDKPSSLFKKGYPPPEGSPLCGLPSAGDARRR